MTDEHDAIVRQLATERARPNPEARRKPYDPTADLRQVIHLLARMLADDEKVAKGRGLMW